MQASNAERLEQEKLLQEYELKRKAKSVVVPTDDAKVRSMLRSLNEPVTLFGEREVRPMQLRGQLGRALLACSMARTGCHAQRKQRCSQLMLCFLVMQMERRERLRRLIAQQEVELAEAPQARLVHAILKAAPWHHDHDFNAVASPEVPAWGGGHVSSLGAHACSRVCTCVRRSGRSS